MIYRQTDTINKLKVFTILSIHLRVSFIVKSGSQNRLKINLRNYIITLLHRY